VEQFLHGGTEALERLERSWFARRQVAAHHDCFYLSEFYDDLTP
jgi:hypothetical protein